MADIQILSEETIDKIAAGEVVERPMSVVKELVENAMDAGALAVTVEIKNGGIDFIRVTDNGKGIPANQVRIAFARHATSKIRKVEDLSSISSMGFRGEALSSIAAVSQVEVITKTKEALTGIKYAIEGAIEKEFEEVGAPDGTTFLVKNLFYNTPVRRKFLKSAQTEGSYVAELLERLAMARPDISFKFILNGQVKFQTPGNNDLKEVIYRIYGREIASHLIPIEIKEERLYMKGFLGKPEINRSNRNFEHYFINARYVKSRVISKAIEEGYKPYVMQHKFPFVVFHLELPGKEVDVNVHPTKMEVRFSDEPYVYRTIVQSILQTFRSKELIVETSFGKDTNEKKVPKQPVQSVPIVKEEEKTKPSSSDVSSILQPLLGLPHLKVKKVEPFVVNFTEDKAVVELPKQKEEKKEKALVPQKVHVPEQKAEETPLEKRYGTAPKQILQDVKKEQPKKPVIEPVVKQKEQIPLQNIQQQTLFEDAFLSQKAKESYEILGQIFDTYWIVAYHDRMYMIDQHAAHEKVKYERLVKALKNKEVLSQGVVPPVIMQVSAKEEQVILEHRNDFLKIGFEIEEFGDHTFCLRAVPNDLFGCSYTVLFREMLDELMEGPIHGAPEVVLDKLASMACKAAVKGNNKLSRQEAVKLIDELLTLENPYHCPHGRPTIISMTKQEIEKKFKRIV